jgi:RHS repeat-associated protein
MTYPNGLSSTFTYDDRNRLKSVNAYQYQLGPTGNRQSATEPGGRALSWTYDGIYRLTQETISGAAGSQNGTVGYGLDPVGNRLSQNSTLSGISTGSATFDANDRLSTETYDNNGNTTVSGARAFAYDFENRVKSMNSGSTTVTLVYDGDGNRVAKTVGGVTTRYLVDDQNPTGYAQVVEESVAGAVVRTYTYSRERISQNQLINGTWKLSFYGYDGSGSVRSLSDVGGTKTDTYDYDAWGNAVNSTGTTPNAYLYRGEQFDSDLGLYYLRARYFNPLSGRFLTRDSDVNDALIHPITLHRYMYGNSDPVDIYDPSGHGGNSFTYASIMAFLTLKVAPLVEATGIMTRGQLSYGISSIMRAAYWHDLLYSVDEIAASMRTVASGVFLNPETGEIIEGTAISANRWTRSLAAAVASAKEVVIRFPWDKTVTGAHHAEQILVEWAKGKGYLVLSVASAAQTICDKYCQGALQAASEAQYAATGVPIFFH